MSKSIEKLLKKKWKFEDIPDQSGKNIIITGANSGLGFIAARELGKKNAIVVMACRNLEKGKSAVLEILNEYPDAKLDLMKLNMACLASIREFSEEFKNKYNQLHVLINNAGVMQPPYTQTEDGFELQIGVNHFGHFTLTGHLMDFLKSTTGSRVITVSSIIHKMAKINFDDINSINEYNRTDAYGQSKMANLLFAYELNRRLAKAGNNVISVAVHPGYSATNLQKAGPSLGGTSKWSRLYKITNKIAAQSVEKGTLSLLYSAVAPDVKGADYIGPKGFFGMRGYPRRLKSSDRSYNEEDAKKLWKISEEQTGIIYEF